EVAPVVPQRLLEVADRPGAVAALEEEAAGLEEARRARTGLRRVGGLLQQVLEITLRVAPLEGEVLEGLDGGDVAGVDLARLEEGGARRVRIEKHLAVDASHAVVELHRLGALAGARGLLRKELQGVGPVAGALVDRSESERGLLRSRIQLEGRPVGSLGAVDLLQLVQVEVA